MMFGHKIFDYLSLLVHTSSEVGVSSRKIEMKDSIFSLIPLQRGV